MNKRISGSISRMLGNFDYMSNWGALKTREEIIGKPVVHYTPDGRMIPIGVITDADPTTDEWFAELYIDAPNVTTSCSF